MNLKYPNNNDLYYFIDWDDGSIEKWLGPYSSGQEVTISHNWSEKGKYLIQAKVKDTNGLESSWGTLSVSMARSRFFNNFFLRLIQQFPILQHLFNLF